MIIRNSRRALACALFATSALATPAIAQQTTNPLYSNWDENNVDLVQGYTRFNFEEGSIGSGKAKLALDRLSNSLTTPSQWDHLHLVRTLVNGIVVTTVNKPDGSFYRFTGSSSDGADGSSIMQTTDPVTFNYAWQLTDSAGIK